MARPALEAKKRTVPGLRFARGVRMTTTYRWLVEKLRDAASAGFDEWRVQDPVDGNLLGGG